MIRFACVYCGEVMTAADARVGTLTQCPACSRAVRVLRQRKPVPASPTREERERESARRKAVRPAAFLPKYDDLTLFALSATLLLLLWLHRGDLTGGELRRNAPQIAKIPPRVLGHLIVLAGIAGIGMVASFVGVFFRREKPECLKGPMLWFAVFITLGTGLYAGYIALKTAPNWLVMIFPAWNLITGVVLLVMFWCDRIDTDHISDEHADLRQIVLTVICIALIVTICHSLLHCHWAITYRSAPLKARQN